MLYFNKTKLCIFLLLLSYLVICDVDLGFTQEKEEKKFPRGAQYFLGTGDELLIKVNIWGFVNKPGQYMVPSETDLISLISYAGGPQKGAKLSNIKVVRLERQNQRKEKIIKVNVKKYLENGNESLIPQLKPDDTIIISGSNWYHINSFVEFVTKIAVLIQIYSWVIYYSGR